MNDTKDKVNNPLVQPVKLGSKMNKFHQQVAEGSKVAQATAPTSTGGFANMGVTVIFPDCSGSMGGLEEGNHDRIFFCKQAVNTFIDNCFIGATQVGIATFPELVVIEPTLNLAKVKSDCEALDSTGSTPMHEPLEFCLDEWSTMTHGIVVSDGCPDSVQAVQSVIKKYRDKGIKLDAVHIGSDRSGESVMKEIAETTGGIYIKFTNVAAFAQAFKFLTPQHRLTLTTSKNPMLLLGAAEVKI